MAFLGGSRPPDPPAFLGGLRPPLRPPGPGASGANGGGPEMGGAAAWAPEAPGPGGLRGGSPPRKANFLRVWVN